jgi:hypothetical protein
MKLTEADVIWTPGWSDCGTAGAVRVERHGSGWQRTAGDRWMPADALGPMGSVSTKGDPIKQLLALHLLFNTMVVRDAVPVAAAHAALLEIDEYRLSISPDTEGADP